MTSKILNEGTALGMEQGRWVEGEGEGVEKQEEEKRENLHLLYASAAFSFPARSWRWAGGHSGGGGFLPFRHPPSGVYSHDHKGWDPSFLLIPEDSREQLAPIARLAMPAASLVVHRGHVFPGRLTLPVAARGALLSKPTACSVQPRGL